MHPLRAQTAPPEESHVECEELAADLQLTPLFQGSEAAAPYRLSVSVLSVPLYPVGTPGQELVVRHGFTIASHDAGAAVAAQVEYANLLLAETNAAIEVLTCEPAWGADGNGLPYIYAELVQQSERGYTLLPSYVTRWEEVVAVPRLPARRPESALYTANVGTTIEDLIGDPPDGTTSPPDTLDLIPPPPGRTDWLPEGKPLPGQKKMDLASIDREQFGSTDITASPELPIYRGIAAMNLSRVVPGMSVIAIEKMDCSKQGNFFIASYGVLKATPELAGASQDDKLDEPPLLVTRSDRLAVNNYFGVVDDPEDFTRVAASTATDGFWCVPKREFCYEQIGFRDYGAKGRAGDTIEVKKGWVFSAEETLLVAFAAAVSDLCAVTKQGVKQ